MFKFQLTDGSTLAITLDLAAARIQVTQTTPSGASVPVYREQTLTIPLVDVKQIWEQVKKLRSYFG